MNQLAATSVALGATHRLHGPLVQSMVRGLYGEKGREIDSHVQRVNRINTKIDMLLPPIDRERVA